MKRILKRVSKTVGAMLVAAVAWGVLLPVGISEARVVHHGGWRPHVERRVPHQVHHRGPTYRGPVYYGPRHYAYYGHHMPPPPPRYYHYRDHCRWDNEIDAGVGLVIGLLIGAAL